MVEFCGDSNIGDDWSMFWPDDEELVAEADVDELDVELESKDELRRLDN